ncbi:unnamed protein product [Lota lota]
MSENHLMVFFVLLLSFLPSESTIKKLKSINGLKTIPFGQSVPQHSLMLLHWFANTIEFDNNNAIELTFEPQSGDYGTHHYGNYERVLPPLPPGHRSYTLGNLNHLNNIQRNSLPSYVTGRLNNLLGPEEMNRARILFTVFNQNIIDRVYITQHYGANQYRGTVYDPVHTYQITVNLLRELRVFSLDQSEVSELSEIRERVPQVSELSEISNHFGSAVDDRQLRSLRNTWGELACLGLLVFIVVGEKNLPCRPTGGREPKRPRKQEVRAGPTVHILVNIPEDDYQYGHPLQARDDEPSHFTCKKVGSIAAGLIIIITLIIIIIIIIHKFQT